MDHIAWLPPVIDGARKSGWERVMLEAERIRIISKLVQERSVVSVLDLVEILGASEATVRRDINGMAEAGILRRIRGGVEALTPRHQSHLVGTPFQLNQEIGVAQKRADGRIPGRSSA
jgi:DeoR family transcriptional regulator, ulaG and ulaABCDEF operon transcriptional repressor